MLDQRPDTHRLPRLHVRADPHGELCVALEPLLVCHDATLPGRTLDVTAANFLPERPTLESLRAAAAGCTACPLHLTGTQTVFGEGAGARAR